MTNTKEAAERLRRLKDDPFTGNGAYPIGASENELDRLQNDDRRIISQAYLSEHAIDDDELITEEWIESEYNKPCGVTIEYQCGLDAGGINVGSIDGCEFMSWKRLQTRGQLRRLIAALTDKRGE